MATLAKIRGLDRQSKDNPGGVIAQRGFRVPYALGARYDAGVAANYTTTFGSNADVTFTASYGGSWGNNVKVAYLNPGTINGALSVAVALGSGTGLPTINVTLATGPGTAATGTVVESGTPSNSDTVTIGSRVYTFNTTLNASPSAGATSVLIGGSGVNALTNLASAINAGSGAGTNYAYGSGVAADTNVSGAFNTATLTLTALTAGTAGNSIALAKSSSNLAVSGADLSGGAQGAITTTAQQIVNAINGVAAVAAGTPALPLSQDANNLVNAALASSQNGTGVVSALSATNLASGTDVGTTYDSSWLDTIEGTVLADGPFPVSGQTATGSRNIYFVVNSASTVVVDLDNPYTIRQLYRNKGRYVSLGQP